jgi:hypothetical protein
VTSLLLELGSAPDHADVTGKLVNHFVSIFNYTDVRWHHGACVRQLACDPMA